MTRNKYTHSLWLWLGGKETHSPLSLPHTQLSFCGSVLFATISATLSQPFVVVRRLRWRLLIVARLVLRSELTLLFLPHLGLWLVHRLSRLSLQHRLSWHALIHRLGLWLENLSVHGRTQYRLRVVDRLVDQASPVPLNLLAVGSKRLLLALLLSDALHNDRLIRREPVIEIVVFEAFQLREGQRHVLCDHKL